MPSQDERSSQCQNTSRHVQELKTEYTYMRYL